MWGKFCYINFMDIKKITEKITLPIAIIISVIIFAIGFYVVQYNKQQSIERQQMLKLQEDRRVEEVKAEQAKKEYVAKRKGECYDIYLQENKNWNNVKDFSYSEVRDICIVKYKSSEPAKTKEKCEGIIKNTSEIKSDYLLDMIFDNYYDCLENWFSKEF